MPGYFSFSSSITPSTRPSHRPIPVAGLQEELRADITSATGLFLPRLRAVLEEAAAIRGEVGDAHDLLTRLRSEELVRISGDSAQRDRLEDLVHAARILVSELSGRSNIVALTSKHNVQQDRDLMDTILARVVKVFGAARPHHAYLFANKSSTRMKVLVYDGFGIWLAARRLNTGRFVWTNGQEAITFALNAEQLQALVTGLPWKTLADDHAICVV